MCIRDRPGGSFEINVKTHGGSATETIRYNHDSRWAMESVSPNSLRIRTPEFCFNPDHAKENGLDQVAKHLTLLSAKLPITWHRPIDVEEEIRKRADEVVAKRFTQKLTNKRGESFYRSAVELDLHEAVVMLHAMENEQIPQAPRIPSFPFGGIANSPFAQVPVRSIGGLLAAVMGICAALKFITRITMGNDNASN